MSFQETLDALYPGALRAQDYFDRTTAQLAEAGFRPDNTIACVGVCRDELTRAFVDGVHRVWGEAFDFSSLGGLLILGRTGFTAALHHAPDARRSRYAFFAMSHIGIGDGGEVGQCMRAGQERPSGACGALMAFRAELESHKVRLDLDPDDVEQSLLKQRLLRRIPYGEIPDLPALAGIMQQVILEDLERGISLTVDPAHCAYAVLTGVQIHGPDRQEWVWPATTYAVVGGERTSVSLG